MRGDVNAPPASRAADGQSDLFHNFPVPRPLQPSTSFVRSAEAEISAGNQAVFGGNSVESGPVEFGSGWADGTLNFSMMPLQFDWITQSLEFDFTNDDVFNSPRNI